MTDDLKRQFEQLVADPPPPSAVPSETVFARVRTVRRRRTAGVVTLVAAAVVAVAVAAGNLTDIDSSPPVTHTPSAPVTVVTGPPSTTPTTTPSSTPSSATTTTKRTTTGTNVGVNTSTPGTHTPPARPQLGVHIVLKPVVQGRDVTMRVTLSGRALVASDEGN